MRAFYIAFVIGVATTPAAADKLGDHPAVVVQRLQASAGYDYASKFYPHPAWLYLYPEAPDVLLAKRDAARRAALERQREREREMTEFAAARR